MKNILTSIILFVIFIGNAISLNAEEMLPSDVYYKNNIAVNEISASSPSLRAPGTDPNPNPNNPAGGEMEGEGGGGQVNAPIGDALLPILSAVFLYGSYVLFKSRRKESTK